MKKRVLIIILLSLFLVLFNVMFFLLSEDSSYITGQAINVTGGFEMR